MKMDFCKRKRRRCAAALRQLAVFFLLTGYTSLHAQQVMAYNAPPAPPLFQPAPQEQKVTLRVKNERLQTVLASIERQTGFVFVYAADDVNAAQRLTLDAKNDPLSSVVGAIAKALGVEAEFINDKIILRAKPSAPKVEKSVERPATQQAANDITVTGRITDETGRGLEGVSVVVKGTSIGTTTNRNGEFSLTLPDDRANAVLVVSSIGFDSREVPLAGRRSITASLTASQNSLEDVVVVGYGTQRRLSVTGAVDKVSGRAIEGRPVTNLTTALQGVSPNLIIQQRNFEPGQPVNINIRGLGTLGRNDPMVVIDGIIGGDINLINPNDVESISVLKDAGSAAIFGSRAGNGVILVTTKKGRKNEKPVIAYNGIYGTQNPRVTFAPVSAWENAYYKNESLTNSGQQPIFTPAEIRGFRERGDGDWRLDNIIRNARQQSHNVSVQGGSANSTYLLSLGFLDQQNNFVGDYGLKRYNLRLNTTADIGKFKLGTILSYVKSQVRDHSFSAGTLIVDASRVPLYYSFADSAGRYLTNPVSAQYNPKGILEQGGYFRSNDDEVFGSISGEYPVLQDLKIRGVFGGTVRSNNGFRRRLQVDFLPGGVYGTDREVANLSYKSLLTNTQLLAEYGHRFGEHDVKFLFGATSETFKSEESALTYIQTDRQLGTPTTGSQIDPRRSFNSNATNTFNGRPATVESTIQSLIGRANYSFRDKYFAEFNFRYDGSSILATQNRWAYYPSVALAWNLSEEGFMQGFRRVGNLKLRGSYGALGNQNVDPYQVQTFFSTGPNAYAFNNATGAGSVYVLGNPDIGWERAATLNLGIDALLLRRKLDLSFDYFDKRTSDILVRRTDVPLLFGASFGDFNFAEVRNRGWEFRATYTTGKAFRQSFNVNLADNLNELVSFNLGVTQVTERKEEFELLRRVGQPITVYYGYKRNGYFQNLDDIKGVAIFNGQDRGSIRPGDIKFLDRDGSGVIDDGDKTILGNPFPRYTFGFTYTGSFKGFDLVLFVQGVGKRDAMIRGEQVEPFHFGYGGTMYKHQTDYWTPTNPDARWPRLAEAGSPSNANNYRTGSDLYLFDASYARLKNVQLGYNLPASVVQKLRMQSARVYLTGQNLLTLTRLDFLDPEITEFDNNTNFNTGANSARAYPLPVFYGFGLDLRF